MVFRTNLSSNPSQVDMVLVITKMIRPIDLVQMQNLQWALVQPSTCLHTWQALLGKKKQKTTLISLITKKITHSSTNSSILAKHILCISKENPLPKSKGDST